MRALTMALVGTALAVFLAGPAAADWDEGEPFKMHHPQLPDLQGWDVYFMAPKVLADDWHCTQSGDVSDVHIWFSSRYDEEFRIQNVHLSIHDNVPASADEPFSKPGKLLWQRDFGPDLIKVRLYDYGDQGWYNPNEGEFWPNDHKMVHQINIENIRDPFYQRECNIYWLDVSVKAVGPDGATPAQLGWKTSRQHFEDDAVWADVEPGVTPEWQPLYDDTGETIDLAFVITPEPGTMLLLAAGAGLALLRRRRT